MTAMAFRRLRCFNEKSNQLQLEKCQRIKVMFNAGLRLFIPLNRNLQHGEAALKAESRWDATLTEAYFDGRSQVPNSFFPKHPGSELASCLLLACLDLCLETLDHHLQKIRCWNRWPRDLSVRSVDGGHRQLKFERVASACLCCSSAVTAFKANDFLKMNSDLWATAISRVCSV